MASTVSVDLFFARQEMRFLCNSLMAGSEGLRKLGIFVGLGALVFVLCRTDYDARTGWRFADYPFSWQISQVTKQQAVSMIDARQIKSYGVRGGQILMNGNDGKWFSLFYSDNQDVVRQLGGQGVPYVAYYDDWY